MRDGLFDDAGYQFEEWECPETVDDFDVCENCIHNGDCNYQDELIAAEEDEWNKLYNDTRF